jgi:hypothetical protein
MAATWERVWKVAVFGRFWTDGRMMTAATPNISGDAVID